MTGPERWPRRPGRRFATVLLLALTAPGPLTGCRTAAVASRNLDATLSSTDTFRYQGPTISVFGDLVDRTLGSLRTITRQGRPEPKMRAIPNPTKTAQRNLMRLADAKIAGSVWRRNEQVRQFARYAATAPSQLARERALLELPPHAVRLAVTEPTPPPTESAANANQLLASIDGLVDAARGMLDSGSPTETELLDFEAAVDLLARTDLDIEGGTRLLRAVGPFLSIRGLPARAEDALARLSEDVQARLVSEALYRGLRDPSAVARAGAYQACLEVFGEDFAIAALFSLVSRDARPGWFDERFGRFDLPLAPAIFTEVHLTTLAHFEARGLPADATSPSSLRSIELRGAIFEALALLATQGILYPDRTRLAAMRALGSVSGGELRTLREEEWAAWFRARSEELSAEAARLRADQP